MHRQLLLPLVLAACLTPVPEEPDLGCSAKKDGPDDAGGAKSKEPDPVVAVASRPPETQTFDPAVAEELLVLRKRVEAQEAEVRALKGGDPKSPPVPTVGRVVLFRVGGTDEKPVFRPGTVVSVCTEGNPTSPLNLQVLVDGTNDRRWFYPSPKGSDSGDRIFDANQIERGMAWKTSVSCGSGIGQWRWPTRA